MHDTTVLLIELGAVILGLGLVGRFAGRIGMSPTPGSGEETSAGVRDDVQPLKR